MEMSDKTNNKELSNNLSEYSNDFVELYKKQPLWIVRWGIFFTTIAIVILLIFSYYIKYPETINTNIIITSNKYTENKNALENGVISDIFIRDGDTVHKDEVLVVFKTDANYTDVLWLNKELKEKTNHISLGEIIKKRKINVGNSINKKLQAFIIVINEKGSKNQISFAFKELKQSIDTWIRDNLIVSNFYGRANYLTILYNGKKVIKGEELVRINSIESTVPTGSILLPARDISKITNNQKVLIKLDNYPFEEYGIIEGSINKISSTSNNDGYYFVSISLPRNLISSNKKQIPFDKDLVGNADIILSNKSIMTRFIQQVLKIKQK